VLFRSSDAVFTVTAADPGLTPASITLKPGWNLVSLELIPTCCPYTNTGCCTCGKPIEGVLADALGRVESVWYFTGGASGVWQSYAPGAPSSLTTMTDGRAYWVKVTSGADIPFTYQGRTAPAGGGMPFYYSYVAGWNMVGFKRAAGGETVQNYLGGTCGTTYPNTNTAWFWNAAPQTWSTLGCGGSMAPDSGYWVFFNVAHNVTPPPD
jgi:hypothetical protein